MKKFVCAFLILFLLGGSTAFAGRQCGWKWGRDRYLKHCRPYRYGYNYRCPPPRPRPYPYRPPPPRPRRPYFPLVVCWPSGPINVCIRP